MPVCRRRYYDVNDSLGNVVAWQMLSQQLSESIITGKLGGQKKLNYTFFDFFYIETEIVEGEF